jgi:hypothetical protein
MRSLSSHVAAIALALGATQPLSAQVRVEPVIGVLLENHMPAFESATGHGTLFAAEQNRGAATIAGVRLDVPVRGRVSFVASYGVARSELSTFADPARGNPGSQRRILVNLASAQAQLRLNSLQSPLSATVSAGPAFIATGPKFPDFDGQVATAAAAAAGYRIGRSVSIIAREEVFVYKRATAHEHDLTTTFGLSFVPW